MASLNACGAALAISAISPASTAASIATVGPDDLVAFRTVTIARDLGKEIEIASGLDAQDRVIESPPDGLVAADPVHVAGSPDRIGIPTAAAR